MVDIAFDIETTSLDPSINGMVTCICTLNILTEEKRVFQVKEDLDEKLMLTEFWKYIKGMVNPHLYSFNGDSFDIPYLVHRSLVREVKIERYIHTDLRKIVNSFFSSYEKRVTGNLAYWAAVLGITQKTLDGSQMIALFLDKKYDEIKDHCSEDIMIVHQLYLRCKNCGVL